MAGSVYDVLGPLQKQWLSSYGPPAGGSMPVSPMSPSAIAAGGKPAIPQSGGGLSTEKSIGIEMDGKHYVIPTIVNGVSLTPDAAVEAFRAGKNQPLGTFGSQQEASAFAENRSRQLDTAFGGPGVLHKGPSSPAVGGLQSTFAGIPNPGVWKDLPPFQLPGTNTPAPQMQLPAYEIPGLTSAPFGGALMPTVPAASSPSPAPQAARQQAPAIPTYEAAPPQMGPEFGPPPAPDREALRRAALEAWRRKAGQWTVNEGNYADQNPA